ncbi:MAG: hypothetical protein A2189_00545 [Paenibacillus sp. RIFOXYA1_FULL_44_5]|nr:MAG: hypothetical protein A2189_00545 [Paenibacillus sp. RIFOXYA1_FULL_44_5]
MSRNWKRMVEKNTQKTNKLRKKQGSSLISEKQKLIYKGRSTVSSIAFVAISIFFFVAYVGRDNSKAFWWTVVLYFLFGLFLFFIRRPYLRIEQNELRTIGFFSAYKIARAEDIEKIILQKGYVTIQLVKKKSPWIFNRAINRFDTQQMSEALRAFAGKNHVSLQDDLSGSNS